MKFHPDRNQGDKEAEAKFKEIKEAYEVLTDAQNVRPMISTDTRPLNRAAWAAVDLAAAASAAALISAISLVMYLAISSVAGVAVSARGADLRYNMDLTLEEAVRGVTKEIRIPTLEECDVCHGSGAKAGTQPQTCPTRHGSGQVQMRRLLRGAAGLSALSWSRYAD